MPPSLIEFQMRNRKLNCYGLIFIIIKVQPFALVLAICFVYSILSQTVDADKSGKITAVELREALLNNNWSHFNSETCRLLIGMFDKDGDGTIDVHEFTALWKYIQDWKNCFDRFVYRVPTHHHFLYHCHHHSSFHHYCCHHSPLPCYQLPLPPPPLSICHYHHCHHVTYFPLCSFDKDRSGNIDALELQQALQSFGYQL